MTDPQPDAHPVDARLRPTAHRAGQVALVVVGAALLALMLVLLGRGPRFVADEGQSDAIAVTCGSILTVGWPSDGSFVAREDSRPYGDHVRSGATDFTSRDGIARDCSERRDTYLGLMVLLAVPTSVCLGVAAARRKPAQPL